MIQGSKNLTEGGFREKKRMTAPDQKLQSWSLEVEGGEKNLGSFIVAHKKQKGLYRSEPETACP